MIISELSSPERAARREQTDIIIETNSPKRPIMEEEEDYFDEEPVEDYITSDHEDDNMTDFAHQAVLDQKPVVVVSAEQVQARVENTLKELVEVIGTNEDWAIVFMENCKWNREKVETDFFTTSLKRNCGFTNEAAQIIHAVSECEICELKHELFWLLGCGHLVCVACCRDYVEFNLTRGDTFFKCMHACCETPFLRSTILKIIQESKSLQQRYQQLLAKRFVENSSNMRCCTSSSCSNILLRNNAMLKEVECPCQTKFCWGCGQRSHKPSSCEQVRNWRVAVIEEPTAGWLKRNTSICPNCKILIQRIGGCSQMTCLAPKGCKTVFCYVCAQEWKFRHKNPYYCPNHKTKHSGLGPRERKIFELTNVNFSLFVQNENNLKVLEKMWLQCKPVQDILFQVLHIDYFETSFIEKYLKSIIEIVNTLKWSYPVTHYSDPNLPTREIFSYQQASAQRCADHVYRVFSSKLRVFITSLEPPPIQYQGQPQQPVEIDVHAKVQQFFELKEQLLKQTKSAQVFQQAVIRTAVGDLNCEG